MSIQRKPILLSTAALTSLMVASAHLAAASPAPLGHPGAPTQAPAIDCNTNDNVADIQTIGAVQGDTDVSPRAGDTVTIRGVVTADMQPGDGDDGDLRGFYLQDAGDDNPATSDAIFVYTPQGDDVTRADDVLITGEVSEYRGQTQIRPDTLLVCGSDARAPRASRISLPVAADFDWEALESMRVRLPQRLTINEYYNFDRYGEIVLSKGSLQQPTNRYRPGSNAAQRLADRNARNRITIDDGRTGQNPDPSRHPAGAEFTLNNRFRGGDTLKNVTGVLDYRFGSWRIQPTGTASYRAVNSRPAPPTNRGNLRVVSFNALNYFTTLKDNDSSARGANNAAELDRQRAKLVAALIDLNADIVGLQEVENNGTAVADLVAQVNQALGSDVYSHIDTGVVGDDAIAQAVIYKPQTVTPVGDYALMTSAIDPEFNDDKNRPAVTQTFQDTTGYTLTVSVNHLKSKGSPCDDLGDPEDPNGQGNCNQTRTKAAAALRSWLATDPTNSGSPNTMILGDLNAYAKEDPVTALTTNRGYINLVQRYNGRKAYSYVFNGQRGTLDYALASRAMRRSITDTTVWHINADEPDILDYDTTFKKPAQDALFEPNAYRASDHDLIVVDLNTTR